MTKSVLASVRWTQHSIFNMCLFKLLWIKPIFLSFPDVKWQYILNCKDSALYQLFEHKLSIGIIIAEKATVETVSDTYYNFLIFYISSNQFQDSRSASKFQRYDIIGWKKCKMLKFCCSGLRIWLSLLWKELRWSQLKNSLPPRPLLVSLGPDSYCDTRVGPINSSEMGS